MLHTNAVLDFKDKDKRPAKRQFVDKDKLQFGLCPSYNFRLQVSLSLGRQRPSICLCQQKQRQTQ